MCQLRLPETEEEAAAKYAGTSSSPFSLGLMPGSGWAFFVSVFLPLFVHDLP